MNQGLKSNGYVLVLGTMFILDLTVCSIDCLFMSDV